MIIKTCSKPTRVNWRVIYMNDFFGNMTAGFIMMMLSHAIML